jgi:hypothetical protein
MFHWSCAEIQVVIRRSRPPLSSVYVSVRDGASQHKKQLLGNFPPSLLFPYVYIFLLQRLPTLMALSTYPLDGAPIVARNFSLIFLRGRVMRSYGLGLRLMTRGSIRLGR